MIFFGIRCRRCQKRNRKTAATCGHCGVNHPAAETSTACRILSADGEALAIDVRRFYGTVGELIDFISVKVGDRKSTSGGGPATVSRIIVNTRDAIGAWSVTCSLVPMGISPAQPPS